MIFLLLAGTIYLIPSSIDFNQFRSLIEKKVSRALKAEITLKGLEFRWMPLPHILLFDVKAVNQDIELTAPYIDLFPKWSSLLTGKVYISRIVLNAPSLFIKGTGFLKKEEKSQKGQPLGKVIIHHGNLRISGKKICSRILEDNKDLTFSEIDGILNLNDDKIKWKFKLKPSFASEFKSAGSFSFKAKTYSADINLFQWKPHTLFLKKWDKFGLKPIDSIVNLKAKIEGSVDGTFSAALSGDIPCLTTHPKDKEIIFSCGYFKMDVHKKPSLLWANIDQLYLEDPAISLAGKVEVKLPDGDNSKPYLKIELTGNDADIGSIRAKALSLFGRHKDVREVFDIVRSGKAIYAKTFFEGSIDKLSKIESYRLEALVKEVSVKIPKVDLHLNKCEGDIKISRAILNGTDLKGVLKKSYFQNGALELGLTGHDKMLNVEFDAKAQISDITPILKKVIKNEKFQREFALFKDLKGTLSGRIKLGNSIKHIKPWVRIDEIDCKGNYTRFSWPIHIKKGGAVITTNSVSWNQIAGTAGQHRIAMSSGKVTWGKGKDTFLDINHFSGSLNSAALLDELSDYKSIHKELKRIVTNASGRLLIKKARLKGPAKRPKKWRYSIAGIAKSLSFSSPMLPAQVSALKYPFSATQKRIKGGPGRINLAKENFNLKIKYLHKNFKPDSLDLTLNGQPGPVLLSWVKEKKWIPEPYFPKQPERVDHLHVLWKKAEKRILLDTKSRFGTAGSDISVELALEHRPGFMHINRLAIRSPSDNCRLELINKGTLIKAFWVGNLSGTTIDKVLENNILLKGSISGNAQIMCDYSADNPALDFNGTLALRDFTWIWGIKPGLRIFKGKLNGSGTMIHVADTQIGVGKDLADIEGLFTLKGSSVAMDLNVEMDHLSFKNLDLFLSSFSAGPREKKRPHITIAGRVKFKLKQFAWEHLTKEDKKERPHTYIFKDVAGLAELFEKEHIRVKIKKADLCTIDLKGEWEKEAEKQFLNFSFYLPHKKNKRFDALLSCLGFKQDLIEGKVAISGWIKGSPNNWTDGEINLVSTNGTLRKLTLLAKLFSLLNVTDLFSSRGLPDLFTEGLKYSEMGIHGIVRNNKIVFDNIYVKGQGLNMFASGELDMSTFELNGLILVSPFKTIDTIVSKVPLVSMIIPGKSGAVFSIPVKVTGNFKDPKLDIMPTKAVTGTIKNIFMNTLKFPWKILNFSNNKDKKTEPGKIIEQQKLKKAAPPPEQEDEQDFGVDFE